MWQILCQILQIVNPDEEEGTLSSMHPIKRVVLISTIINFDLTLTMSRGATGAGAMAEFKGACKQAKVIFIFSVTHKHLAMWLTHV